MRLSLLLLLLLPLTASAQTTVVYNVDKTVKSIVEEHVDIPLILNEADVQVTITARPKYEYYKTEIVLLHPYKRIYGFHKTIEVWDKEKIVRSTLDIDLNIRCRLIKRFLEPRIEYSILSMEQALTKSALGLK